MTFTRLGYQVSPTQAPVVFATLDAARSSVTWHLDPAQPTPWSRAAMAAIWNFMGHPAALRIVEGQLSLAQALELIYRTQLPQPLVIRHEAEQKGQLCHTYGEAFALWGTREETSWWTQPDSVWCVIKEGTSAQELVWTYTR